MTLDIFMARVLSTVQKVCVVLIIKKYTNLQLITYVWIDKSNLILILQVQTLRILFWLIIRCF